MFDRLKCGQCGSTLPAELAGNQCPQCGADLRPPDADKAGVDPTTAKGNRKGRRWLCAGAIAAAVLAVTAVTVYFVIQDQLVRRQYAEQLTQARGWLRQNQIEQGLGLLYACRWDLRDDEHRNLCWPYEQPGRLIVGHDNDISTVVYSPDGRWIISGTGSRLTNHMPARQNKPSINLWDAKSRELVRVLLRNEDVACVAFSHDGRRIVGSSSRAGAYGEDALHSIRVWDTATHEQLLHIDVSGVYLDTVVFSPDGKRIMGGLVDKRSRYAAETYSVWDTTKGQPAVEKSNLAWNAQTGELINLFDEADGNSETDRTEPGKKRIRDVATGEVVLELESDRTGRVVTHLVSSPEADRLAVRYSDNVVELWDIAAKKMTVVLKDDQKTLRTWAHVAWSSDGTRLAAATTANLVGVYDTRTGARTAALAGHRMQVTSVAFHPTSSTIVSGSLDATIRLWDWPPVDDTPSSSEQPITASSVAVDVAFSRNGKQILLNAGIASINARTGVATGVSGDEEVLGILVWDACARSPNGRRIAVGDAGSRRTLIFGRGGQKLQCAFGGVPWCMAFSPDGRRLASGNGVWDATQVPPKPSDTIKLLFKLGDADGGKADDEGYHDVVTSVAYSPDGKRIVTGTQRRRVGRMESIWTLNPAHPSADLLPDSDDLPPEAYTVKTINVYDASDGKRQLVIKEPAGVLRVAFSPDSQRIISANEDYTLKVWDASNGKQLAAMRGHWDRISDIAISRDGKWIASGGWDKTVRLWDAETGVQLHRFIGHIGYVSSVDISPDGRRVASCSGDRTLKVWDIGDLARDK